MERPKNNKHSPFPSDNVNFLYEWIEYAEHLETEFAKFNNVALSDAILPKGMLCKCGNEFLIYNDIEGLNVCTLCGKSELA